MAIKPKEHVAYNNVFMSEEPIIHVLHNQEKMSFTEIARKLDIPLYKAHNDYKEEEKRIKKAEALITNYARVYWYESYRDRLSWREYRAIEDMVLRECGLRYSATNETIVPKEQYEGKKWTMKCDMDRINNEIYGMMYEVVRMKYCLRNAVEIKWY